jgi:predicted outer membrane repeat protein
MASMSLHRLLLLTVLFTFPLIAVGQWEYETVTTGGHKCDIAVDAIGNPHISYREQADGWDLKYVRWDGSDWYITPVETTLDVYGAPSIAIDESGIPHIAFKVVNSFWSILYHAWWNDSSWQQAGVDSLAWGDLGEWSSIDIASDGYPHIAYSVYTEDYDCYLKYAYQDASGWHYEIADSLLSEEYRYVSLALDADNHPHISYYLTTAEELRYAFWNESIWQKETVDAADDVGQYSSIAVDGGGNPHISYTDYWGVPPTKYTYWDGEVWQIEAVDPTEDALELYTSLALDADDQPHMSYGEYNGPLKYAFKDESWETEIVDETVECGWTSISVDDSGSTHIAYFDANQVVLKYAKKSPVPADITPPPAPQSLSTTSGLNQISLEWLRNMEADAAGYRIYGGNSAGPTTLIDSTTNSSDTTTTIQNLSGDTTYYFRITAVDTAGNESGYSNEVSAIPVGISMWHVSTTGSDETGDGTEGNPFASIQYTINYAGNGDTVLVNPGTYIENINYNGRNIVLGSLFLTTLDTSHISQTVIDGNSTGRVVTFENGEDSTAVLSGFLIINGNTVGDGGGIYVYTSNPTLNHLIIQNNQSGRGGGIACINNSNPIIFSVQIKNNSSSEGGGIYCRTNSSPRIYNTLVSSNVSTTEGGGFSLEWDCNPSIENVTVSGNISIAGGGIRTNNSSNPILTNVIIYGNTALESGGGFHIYNSNPILTDVTISGNTAVSYGGGISCDGQSSPILENVTIENNAAVDGGGIFLSSSSPSLIDVTVRWNTAELTGGGIVCDNWSNPSLVNVTVSENMAIGNGGGIRCRENSSPSMVNVTISGNTANYGGGIHCLNNSNPIIQEAFISGNSTQNGGGIACNSSSPRLIDVILSGNSALNHGGGINCYNNSSPSLINVTISDNTAGWGGGVAVSANSNPVLVNTILWNNTPEEIGSGEGLDSITIAYSNVSGGQENITFEDGDTIIWLQGNIDVDPLFVDGVYGDFQLQDESPCIDAGTSFFIWGADTLINSGLEDYIGWAPDMGALENQSGINNGDGLLAYYPFNGNADDGSGMGHDGEVNGSSLTRDRFGHYNSAYSFDGVDDYIDLGEAASIIPENASLSISIWVVPHDVSAIYTLLSCETNDRGFKLYYRPYDGDMINAYIDEVPIHGDAANTPAGRWSHLVMTWSSETGFNLYINGTFAGGADMDAWGYYSAADPLFLGAHWEGGVTNAPYDGILDDIRIYDRALTLGEINSLYHEGGWPPEPQIISIVDLPEDQGGWVWIEFEKCLLDQGSLTAGSYTIERLDPHSWTAVQSITAVGLENYLAEARTLVDSSHTGDGITQFRVQVSTTMGDYVSAPAEGYSVDNIAPAVPTSIIAIVDHNWDVTVNWSPAIDQDFASFKVYRSITAEFELSDELLIEETADNFLVDPLSEIGEFYYRVSAVDVHGNESGGSEAASVVVVSLDTQIIPVEFTLEQNYPNPFNPSTNICYGIPEDSQVSLIIYDVQGNVIQTLESSRRSAGWYKVVWDGETAKGKSISTGIYFARLVAGDYTQVIKLVYLK